MGGKKIICGTQSFVCGLTKGPVRSFLFFAFAIIVYHREEGNWKKDKQKSVLLPQEKKERRHASN